MRLLDLSTTYAYQEQVLKPIPGAVTAFLAAIFLLSIASSGALAQSSDTPSVGRGDQVSVARRPELERWVPALSAFGGFQLQESNGSIVHGNLNPAAPRCTAQPVQCVINNQIQPSVRGDDDILAVRLGLSLEIMTPRLAEVWGSPRLFAHVDAIYVEGFERNVAGSGNPGPMVEAFLPPAVTRSEESVYGGQGSRLLAEVSPLVVSAGLGVALSFEVLEHTVRVRPSVEYLTERLSITGQTNRVVQVAQNPTPRTPSNFRFISLRDVDRKRYHAVGAGVDLELDTDRLGPIVVSPFTGVRVFYFPGDLGVDLSNSNEFGETATWRFTRNAVQWEARVGIRLRWAPK